MTEITEDAPFGLPDGAAPELDPNRFIERLVGSVEEFSHLDGIDFAVVFQYTISARGKVVLADVNVPAVQGRLRELFAFMLERMHGRVPDYLMRVNWLFWTSATPEQREALIFHELCHVRQKTDADGVPMFDDETGLAKTELVAHDIEEFDAVVRRYGAWLPDIESFRQALQDYDDAARV